LGEQVDALVPETGKPLTSDSAPAHKVDDVAFFFFLAKPCSVLRTSIKYGEKKYVVICFGAFDSKPIKDHA